MQQVTRPHARLWNGHALERFEWMPLRAFSFVGADAVGHGQDLEDALKEVDARRTERAPVDVHLNPQDCSAAMKRLGAIVSGDR